MITEKELLKGGDASKEKKKNKYQIEKESYDKMLQRAIYVASG